MTGQRKVKSSPYMTLGAQSRNAAYQINTGTEGSAKGRTLVLTKDTRNSQIRIGSNRQSAKNYTVEIIKASQAGENEYAAAYKIQPNQQAFLRYGTLAKKKGLAWVTIKNRVSGKLVRRVPVKEIS